ncbi:MAG: hypothetical protein V3W20_09085 [Candidatus Neomarinimicrobiota bacterium]
MLVCEMQIGNCSGQWSDLKTSKGYINRMRKHLKGQIKEFLIYFECKGKVQRYVAFKSGMQRYYDYRNNEFKSIDELISYWNAKPIILE